MSDIDYYEFMMKDAREQKWLKSRPVCDWCKEPIQDDSAIYFETAHQWLCNHCADDMRRVIPDESEN